MKLKCVCVIWKSLEFVWLIVYFSLKCMLRDIKYSINVFVYWIEDLKKKIEMFLLWLNIDVFNFGILIDEILGSVWNEIFIWFLNVKFINIFFKLIVINFIVLYVVVILDVYIDV